MSALNKKLIYFSNTNKNSSYQSNIINKFNLLNVPLKKKTCSSTNIKSIKEDLNIKYNNTTKFNEYNNIYESSNSNKKVKNKINKIPKKKEHKKINTNILNQNKKKNINEGNIESYPSIISTDTLTLKNKNINISKKNETEHIFSFIHLNNKYKKDSFLNNSLNSNNNSIIKSNRNKSKSNSQKINLIYQKYLSRITTDERNDNLKGFSKSELNEIKKNYNRCYQNPKDMDKIRLDIKFDNISTINEIDTTSNNFWQKNIKNKECFEPEFIQEIKEKNFFKINNNFISEKDKKDSFDIHLNYNSNTENNHKNKNFINKYNLENISKSNNIMNYLTYFKDKETDNYYILSPINSTFKQINSRKSNSFGKIFWNHKQIEEINEDDIDTVKQENTFVGSKIESMTSETYKEIQIPKIGKYFFDVPEDENYNYIQGPIEFEYDNSSGKDTLNNKEDNNDNNCSKFKDISMFKIQKKVINDDGNVYYYDLMKEKDDLKENIIKNNNNIYSSISSNNEKTISNNCSFNNVNINKINNNNNILNEEFINKENINKIFSRNENILENKKEIQNYKKVNSYQKKIIKGSFDLNISKTFKASTKINQNFSEIKKKKILLYRLKNYKIKFLFDILQKVIKNYKRKIFNKFKNINYKINQLFNLLEKIYQYKIKENFLNNLFKYIYKKNNFPLFLPNKIYPSNKNNCNILNNDNNNQIENFGNDYEKINNSCKIYYDNNRSSIIKNNLTQNEAFNNPIKNKLSSEKTDSYFYEKKLFHSKNTIPFVNINYFDKNDYFDNKKKINQKKNFIQKNYKPNILIPKKNMVIYNNKLNNTNLNNNIIKLIQSEKTDDSNINNQKSYKSNNIENKEDDILEQAYKFKFLDEETCSNGNSHRNIKIDFEDSENKKHDTLKAYFFKEFEKLEFPNKNDNKNKK